MNLRQYLDQLPRGGVAVFAKDIGIGPVYLSQLAGKQEGREPSPELCVRMEQKSGGKVTRPELRDDWRLIWPELAEAAKV